MKYLNWIGVVLLTFALIGVRILEDKIFYDPFLDFFRTTKRIFPSFEWSKIILSHIFRFSLNLSFSLGIIHLLFLDRKWTLQAGGIIISSFLIFFPIYLYCLYTQFGFGELFAFYVRRIVIQPIILLIIVPLFYYRKHLNHQ